MAGGRVAALALCVLCTWMVAGCSGVGGDGGSASAVADSTEPPEPGTCRMLEPADLALASNGSATVPCTDEHTAETFAVSELPEGIDDAGYGSEEVRAHMMQTCTIEFADHLGGDESLMLRTILSWASFAPSEAAWDDGARWFRCDVVGGTADSATLTDLPETTRGLLKGKTSADWLSCVAGDSVDAGERVPCSEPHDWRAVSTVQLGETEDSYPGDATMRKQSRDFCSEQVAAQLGYPVDYDFGFTWFGEQEWEAGNRRSICWARTKE